jgi:glucokinase
VTAAIGIDIGGTKVAAGVVDDAGRVQAILRRPTPGHEPAKVVDLIVDLVNLLAADHPVAAVGIGAAGLVDVERATVRFAANLAWRDEPLRADVAARVSLPVVIENDANAAAWGEYRFGAGDQQPDVVVLTIGTGIGGAIILDGRLHRGRFGAAGEPGHLRVVPNGLRCGCGNDGCLEQYSSGTALVRAAREVARTRPADGCRMLELAGGDVSHIDGPVVTQAAREGDPAAVACFEEIGRWLGQGLADLAAILDPGRFVIGGGVAEAGELLLAPARTEFAQALTGAGYRPLAEVVSARLGEQAGLIGAADLARQP